MPDNATAKNASDVVLTFAFDSCSIGGVPALVAHNKIGFGADGEYAEVSTTNPLPVAVAGSVQGADGTITLVCDNLGDIQFPETQPVSVLALPLPAGAATAAKQPAFALAGSPSGDVLTVQGKVNMTPIQVDGSGVTQPVSGSVNIGNLPATQPISGSVAVLNFPTTQPISGSVNVGNLPATQPISATGLPLPAGAATQLTLASLEAKAPNLGSALKANSVPVTIASDQPAVPVSGAVTANLGTVAGLALDATLTGGTARTQLAPATSGGCDTFRKVSTADSSACVAKASAGQLYGYASCTSATAGRYLQIYDKATNPTIGADTIKMTIPMPAGGGANASFPQGISFLNGIAGALTSDAAGTSAAGITAGGCVFTLVLK